MKQDKIPVLRLVYYCVPSQYQVFCCDCTNLEKE